MSEAAGAGVAGKPTPLPDPIKFILNEHDRQLDVCDALETLVSVLDLDPVGERAGALLRFLTADLPLHIEDEERDLFPMLMARCEPRGEMDEILNQLVSEHDDDKELASLIVADLRELRDGGGPAHPVRFHSNARTFCELQRRHLIWENRLVLPLAERHLSAADKADLGRRLTERRRAGA